MLFVQNVSHKSHIYADLSCRLTKNSSALFFFTLAVTHWCGLCLHLCALCLQCLHTGCFATTSQFNHDPPPILLCSLQTFKHYFGTRQMGQARVFFITFVQQLELSSLEGLMNVSGKQPIFLNLFIFLWHFVLKLSSPQRGEQQGWEQLRENCWNNLSLLGEIGIFGNKEGKDTWIWEAFVFASNQTESEWGSTQYPVCSRCRRFGIFFMRRHSHLEFSMPPIYHPSTPAPSPCRQPGNATWVTSFLTHTLNKSMFARRQTFISLALHSLLCIVSHTRPFASCTNTTAGGAFIANSCFFFLFLL